MNERDFCYWLRGFFEIDEASDYPQKQQLTIKQVDMIKEHLELVFEKVTKEHEVTTDTVISPVDQWSYTGMPDGYPWGLTRTLC